MKETVVCITGAAGHVGSTIASLFEEKGTTLILLDQKEGFAKDHKFKDALKYEIDLCQQGAIEDVLKDATNQVNKKMDYLINCASIFSYGDVLETDVDTWNKVININLSGTFYAIKAVLPYMIQQKFGRIVNIGSIFSQISTYKLAAYSASKAALIALTQSVALDFSQHNIRCNCIAPSLIRNPFGKDYFQTFLNNNKAFLEGFHNLPKIFIKADEVAELAYYLATSSEGINGQVIPIDYGYTAR